MYFIIALNFFDIDKNVTTTNMDKKRIFFCTVISKRLFFEQYKRKQKKLQLHLQKRILCKKRSGYILCLRFSIPKRMRIFGFLARTVVYYTEAKRISCYYTGGGNSDFRKRAAPSVGGCDSLCISQITKRTALV